MGATSHVPETPAVDAGEQSFRLLQDESGIEIAQWTIRGVQGAIMSSATEESLSRTLRIKLPGMLFDKGCLSLNLAPESSSHHPPSQPQSSPTFQLHFRAVDALEMVGGADPNIKVKAAEKWKARKQRPDMEIGVIESASDWTFSTKYGGTLQADGLPLQLHATTQNNRSEGVASPRIHTDGNLKPINLHALRDTSLPILFSSQVILFEDELDDNGIASYKVRIRVMPTFFFILARFFLRVDDVLIRIYDTRYYHEFGTDIIVRESVIQEARITAHFKTLHPSILQDPDLVSQNIPISARELCNIRIRS